MFSRTPVRRIGTLSTVLANSALYLAHWAGLQTPAAALLLAGGFFRCLTLPLTIYGDQCLHRVAAAYPELQDAHKSYLDIVEHPKAIAWEKRVAAQKLKNDRERVFRSYRTNNVKMVGPHVGGAAISLYCLGVPAQQLGTFFIHDAGMAIVSPLAVSYVSSTSAAAAAAAGGHFAWTSTLMTTSASLATTASSSILFTVDPTLAIAAGLTYFNVCQHLRQRRGFNKRLDRWIDNARHAAGASCLLLVAGSLLSGPAAYALALPALHFFPPYVAPVWLGMSVTTSLKNLLVNCTGPGRALFRLAPYPPQHGTYGEESTAAGHEYRIAFTGIDVEETRHVWQTQKRILDYECDVRIHAWLTRLGVFNDLDELAYEAEQLQRKREVAHERRLAREGKGKSPSTSPVSNEGPSSPAASATEADASQDGLTQAARRRRAMRQETASAPATFAEGAAENKISEAAVFAEVDRIQEDEYKRRQKLKAAREAAWKKNH